MVSPGSPTTRFSSRSGPSHGAPRTSATSPRRGRPTRYASRSTSTRSPSRAADACSVRAPSPGVAHDQPCQRSRQASAAPATRPAATGHAASTVRDRTIFAGRRRTSSMLPCDIQSVEYTFRVTQLVWRKDVDEPDRSDDRRHPASAAQPKKPPRIVTSPVGSTIRTPPRSPRTPSFGWSH